MIRILKDIPVFPTIFIPTTVSRDCVFRLVVNRVLEVISNKVSIRMVREVLFPEVELIVAV